MRRKTPYSSLFTFHASRFTLLRGSAVLLDLGDVLGSGALRTLHDVELHPVTLGEAAEAVRLDGGMVDEAILVPILRSDETKTFCVVEPLHRAEGASHWSYSIVV